MGGSLIQRLRVPEARACRVAWQKGVIVCALLVFAASLALPAGRVTWELGQPPHPVSGLTVLVTSPIYYPSNTLFLVAPLSAWLVRQFRGPFVQRAFTFLHVASLLFVAAAPFVLRRATPMLAESAVLEMYVAAGFYTWVAAHALMAVALWLPVWGAAAAQRDAREELRVLHDKWVRGADRAARPPPPPTSISTPPMNSTRSSTGRQSAPILRNSPPQRSRARGGT